jgi:exonuclease-1
MGISELLKILKPVIVEKHLSEFKNKTAAVDMMGWIYRGVYACAVDIARGIKSDLYLNFPLKMLALLKSFNITPIAVFDGNSLKAKESIDEIRKENKVKNLQLANSLLSEGKEEESRRIFRRALKITSKMINTCIEILKKLQVKVIIAPYEADAQIAFLCKNHIADFAITEDSDLIPFGVDQIAYKLNISGYFLYLDMQKLRNSSKAETTFDKWCKIIGNMKHFNLVEFCVMLGCDYLPSIRGFGFKTGINLFEKHKNIENVFKEIIKIPKFKKHITDPEAYINKARKIVALFFLQCVYDPIQNKLCTLFDLNCISSDIQTEEEDKKFREVLISLYSQDKEFYGKDILKFEDFCRGNLCMKLLTKEKKLEKEEVIIKYFNINKFQFKIFNYGKERKNTGDENLVPDEIIETVEIMEAYKKENDCSYSNKCKNPNLPIVENTHKYFTLEEIIEEDWMLLESNLLEQEELEKMKNTEIMEKPLEKVDIVEIVETPRKRKEISANILNEIIEFKENVKDLKCNEETKVEEVKIKNIQDLIMNEREFCFNDSEK